MKAILHNKEDDLHFLLKCLVEELEDKAIIKADEEEDKNYLDVDSNANDALEDEIFDSQDQFEQLEQEAIENAEIEAPKKVLDEEDETERKITFNSEFYDELKLELDKAKKDEDLTQKQKLDIVYKVRKKYYDRFIQENKPMAFKLGNTEYSYTVKEIKDTWKEYTNSRKTFLATEELRADTIKLTQLQNELAAFQQKGKRIKPKYGTKKDEFDAPAPKTRFGEYAPSSKEGKRIAAFMSKETRLKKELANLVREQTEFLDKDKKDRIKPYIEDDKEREKQAKKLNEKEKKLKEQLQNLEKEFVEDWKKRGFALDKKGNPNLSVNRQPTVKEIKETQAKIKALTTKVNKNKKTIARDANNSIRVSSLKVLEMTERNTGQPVKDLKELLENEAVKVALGKKTIKEKGKDGKTKERKIPPKIPNITLPHHYIPFKGKYTDEKLREYLKTDSKAKGMKQTRGRKGAMIVDGQGVQKEAIQRIFNYLQYLLTKIQEEEEGTTRKKINELRQLLTERNTKILASLQDKEESLTKYTKPFYETLQKELRELKDISKLKGTSDEKRMLVAKEIFEGTKYGLEMIRDAITILQGDSVSDDKIERLVDIKENALSRGKIDDKKSQKRRRKLTQGRKALLEIRERINELNRSEDEREEVEKLRIKLRSLPTAQRKDKKNEVANKIRNRLDELDKKIKDNEKEAKRLTKDVNKRIKGLGKFLQEQEISDVKGRKDKKLKDAFKKADLVGKEAYKYFDVVMPTSGDYYFARRQYAMFNELEGFSALETIVKDIQKTLEDDKIVNAIKGTYKKLTGKTVFEQDTTTTDKKKQLKRALDQLPDFVRRRVEMKEMLSPIPDFVVKDMLKKEAELSTGLLSALKNLSLVGLIDDNSPISFGVEDTRTWKLSEMERKKVTTRGQKFAPIFPMIVQPEFTRNLKEIEEDVKVGKIKEIGVEQVQQYWDVLFDKVRAKADAIKQLEDAKEPSKERFGTVIEALNNLSIKTKEQEKIEEQMEQFIELMDEKQEILTVLQEVEVFVDKITKLRKSFASKADALEPTKQSNYAEALKEYADTMIDRFDDFIDKGMKIPKEIDVDKALETWAKTNKVDLASAEEAFLAEGKEDKKLSEYKKVEARLKEQNKKAKETLPNLFRFEGIIKLSAEQSQKILEDTARANEKDSLQELFDSNMTDEGLAREIILEATKVVSKEDYDKLATTRAKGDAETFIEEVKEVVEAEKAFDALVKTFKTKTKVFDFSKLKIDASQDNIKELLANEMIGKEFAEMIDLTDAFDAYRKQHKKVQEKHLENIEGQKKIQKEADDSLADIIKNFRGSFDMDLVSTEERPTIEEEKDEKYEMFKTRIQFMKRGGMRVLAENNPKFAEKFAKEDTRDSYELKYNNSKKQGTFKELLEDFKAQKQEEDQKEKERLRFLEEQEGG